MAAEDRCLDIGPSDAEELRLDQRMVSPDDDPRRVRGHDVIFGALPDVETRVAGGHSISGSRSRDATARRCQSRGRAGGGWR
jgi:hypothetical protein